jgi:alpha-D-ribose 1-methylphosphonate 5-triphosphate synthase subunit PhnH
VRDYLGLHTGAPICEAPSHAAFAFVSCWRLLPELSSFAPGTLEFPDSSTTVVLEVEELEPVAGWHLAGPGIAGHTPLSAGPLPAHFEQGMQANRQCHPRGVDVVLCCGERLAALPRTTRIERGL